MSTSLERERVGFRLALILALAFAIGFAGAALQARRAANLELRAADRLALLMSSGGDNQPVLLRYWEVTREHDAIAAAMRAYMLLAVAAPLFVLLGFVAIRWALTGRLSPLWPLGRAVSHGDTPG